MEEMAAAEKRGGVEPSAMPSPSRDRGTASPPPPAANPCRVLLSAAEAAHERALPLAGV